MSDNRSAEPAGARDKPRSLKEDLAALRIDRSAPAAPRPRRGTLLLAALGALGVLAALGIARWWLAAPARLTVEYATRVEAGTPAASVALLSGSGYVVTAEKYISIGVRIPGRIASYFADEADRVKAGDPLVALDDRDYRAALQAARARLEAARANAALHRLDLERKTRLRERDFASQADLDAARALLRVDEAQVAQAQAEVAQAQVNLDYTVLRAPSDGVVLAKLKEVGEMAVPGGFAGSGDLIRMANLSELRAEVDVAEADLSRVALGQPARVVPDAYPDRQYTAHVAKLYPQVNRQKGTLKVEVAIDEPDELLLPDMSVRIQFLSTPGAPQPAGTQQVRAPASALRGDADGSFVWVLREGALRRQPVTAGPQQGPQVVIEQGLSGGEALVVGDDTGLRDGQRAQALAP